MGSSRGVLIGRKSRRLVYRAWRPAGACGRAEAAVLLVHGVGEHVGRYTHVVAALVARGYAVWALDHRGHGESEGGRAYVERFAYLVDDLRLLALEARASFARGGTPPPEGTGASSRATGGTGALPGQPHPPGTRASGCGSRLPTLPAPPPGQPTFMLGHSMGGLIAIHYALRYQAELAGLVLSAPALRFGDEVSPVLKRLAPVLATLVPRLPVTRGYSGNESVLSRNPAVQARYDADPLCFHGRVCARTGYELLAAAAAARARLETLTLPLLIIHGTADRFVSPEGSRDLYARARSADKTLELWPGLRHEPFNEPEQAEVIAFALDWLDERVRRASRPGTA